MASAKCGFLWAQGYRLYFTIRRGELIVLLNGGGKSSQQRDIKRARQILGDLEV